MNPYVKDAIDLLFDQIIPDMIANFGTEIPEPHLLWLDLHSASWRGAAHPYPIPQVIDDARLTEVFHFHQRWCQQKHPAAVARLFNAIERTGGEVERLVAVIVEVSGMSEMQGRTYPITGPKSLGASQEWRDLSNASGERLL